VAADRADKVAVPTSLTVDNQGGAGDRTIRIQDVFTPSATNGTGSPSETTVDRFRMQVDQGDMVTLGEEDLKGIKCLGALKVIGSVIDTGCYVTVGYKHE